MYSVASILNQYKALMSDVDARTAEVFAKSPEIPCKNKCFDCCEQLFPVSFTEAFYISEGFKTLPRNLRRERERVAKKIAEKICLKNPEQFEKRGVSKIEALKIHSAFAQFLHGIETDCPALDRENPAGSCTVYEFRNHDCRTMGASFDASDKSIVGCFRFNSLKYLVPKLMDFNYRYADKMALDRALISTVTGGIFTQNIIYYTTMCGPLLKDFAAEDWRQFFEERDVPKSLDNEKYWVVIDS